MGKSLCQLFVVSFLAVASVACNVQSLPSRQVADKQPYPQHPTESVGKVAVGVTTTDINLAIGESFAFQATVANAADGTVTWSIAEGDVGGTISPDGLYTAPMQSGLFHVVAASHADAAVTAEARVNVYWKPIMTEACLWAHQLEYGSPGGDGVWATADDVVARSLHKRYDAGLFLLYEDVAEAPGDDGLWGTADDPLLAIKTHAYDQNGRLWSSVAQEEQGEDGKWHTADDGIDALQRVYDEQGNMLLEERLSGWGPDLAWRTDDDLRTLREEFRPDGQRIYDYHDASPGGDGVWQTDDDDFRSATLYRYAPDGSLLEARHLAGSGPDGKWFTPDDVEGRTWYFSPPKPDGTTVLTVEDVGADGAWGTQDDSATYMETEIALGPSALERRVWQSDDGDGVFDLGELMGRRFTATDASGRVVDSVVYHGPGTDGIWLTPDDRGSRTRYEYGENVTGPWQMEMPMKVGADGQWQTDDDEIELIKLRQFNAESDEVLRLTSLAPGADGTWLTGDDVLSSFSLGWERVPGGQWTAAWAIGSIGPDNRWLTADDELTLRFTQLLDERGQVVQLTRYGAGDDGVFDTGDDTIAFRQIMTYDPDFPAGDPSEISIDAAGDDGVWGTPDDVRGSTTLIDYDAWGNRLFYGSPTHAGEDGLWETEDDVFDGYMRAEYAGPGLPTFRAHYVHPGDDGLWLTEDDVPSGYTTVAYDGTCMP